MDANDRQTTSDRTSLRDAGLRRIRHASRWLAGGAVVLTGAFAGLAGASTKSSQSAGDAAGSGGGAAATAPAQTQQFDDDDGGDGFDGDERRFDGDRAQLQQPAQPPQQAPSGSAPQSSTGAS